LMVTLDNSSLLITAERMEALFLFLLLALKSPRRNVARCPLHYVFSHMILYLQKGGQPVTISASSGEIHSRV
jgi:hypothetical protein